jgi:hypothetical protein
VNYAFQLVAVYQGGLGKHMSTLSPDTISIGVKVCLPSRAGLWRGKAKLTLALVSLALRALVSSRNDVGQAINWPVSPTIYHQPRSNLYHLLRARCKHHLRHIRILFCAFPMPSCVGILVKGKPSSARLLYEPRRRRQSLLRPSHHSQCNRLDLRNRTDLHRP